jgi:hypothetical protein
VFYIFILCTTTHIPRPTTAVFKPYSFGVIMLTCRILAVAYGAALLLNMPFQRAMVMVSFSWLIFLDGTPTDSLQKSSSSLSHLV